MKNADKIKKLKNIIEDSSVSEHVKEEAKKKLSKIEDLPNVPKYKKGEMVYSYQNKNKSAKVSRIDNRGEYGFAYLLTLTDDEGYSRSSKWINEESLSKEPLEKGEGMKALLKDEPKKTSVPDTDEMISIMKEKSKSRKNKIQKKEKRTTKIVNTGMGGYLNPPKHPEHSYSVQTDLNKKQENRGSINLSYALYQDYVDESTKNEIKKMLSDWEKEKPEIDSDEFRKWEGQVSNHFSGMKKEKIDFIRKFYPEYK